MRWKLFLHVFHRHRAVVLLTIFWFFALFCGILAAHFTGEDNLAVIRNFAHSSVSFPGVLFGMVLPVFVCSAAVAVGRKEAVFFVAACRAFSYAYIAVALHIIFGSAGWLVRLFSQAASCLSLPLFFWYSLRRLSDKDSGAGKDLLIVCVFMVAIAAIVYYLFAPLVLRIASIF